MEIKPMLFNELKTDVEKLSDSKWLSDFISSNYPNWIVQEKFNGDRVLIHIKRGKVTSVRNRRDIPQLFLYPELKKIKFDFDTAIIDCEICVLDKGKSNFYTLREDEQIKVAGINLRSMSLKNEDVIKEYPVKLMAFDVLKFEDKVTIGMAYDHRYQILADNIKDGKFIEVVKNVDLKKKWNEVLEKNLEGVMIKNPKACYELDKRTSNSLKVKFYKKAEMTVEDYEKNNKGMKLIGKAKVNGNVIDAECQMFGLQNVEIGERFLIKYLDIVKNRFIQPTKLKVR